MLMGRTEQRGAVNFKARLRSVGVPSYFEAVSIRNVSLHGAQVVTLLSLRVQSRVELIAAMGDFHVAAEVVYCKPLVGDRCAVGLWFPNGVALD